jgi:hypothetical protein
MAHYPLNHHLRQPYRFLAGLGGLYLLLFGVIGIGVTAGEPLFNRGSDWVLGLRTNAAASWVSAVVGLVVLGVAIIGGNLHHRVNLVLGYGIAGYAMVVMTMIQTSANVFNVSMINVIVFAVIGLVLIVAGLYGRVGPVSESSASGA